MNQSKRNGIMKLQTAILLGIAAIGQPATIAKAEHTFPQDGDAYEWNSVTWVPKSIRLHCFPCECEKCGEQQTGLSIWGKVDVDFTNTTTGRRGSRRVKVVAKIQEKDTRQLPDAMDVFLRRDGSRIDAIDTENTDQGLATIKSVYRENRQNQRPDYTKPFVKNGLRYLFCKWKPGTLHVITLKSSCNVCDHIGPSIQFLAGTFQNSWVESVEAPHTGKKAWTNEVIPGISGFLGPNDVSKTPSVAVLEEQIITTAIVDLDDEADVLITLQALRREWEKAHRD